MVPDEVGNTGSSTSPCSDLFSGPEQFSEPECYAIDRFLNAHIGIFDAYLAVCKTVFLIIFHRIIVSIYLIIFYFSFILMIIQFCSHMETQKLVWYE